MEKYYEYMWNSLADIMKIDSPTGFTRNAARKVMQIIDEMGFKSEMSNKGGVSVLVKGESSEKVIGVSAHLDTLGAMVRSVSPKGLRFSLLGGVQLPTLDGEYCRIYTRGGAVYTGTFLSDAPSSHVYKEARTLPRDCEHMRVRLDEVIKNDEDIKRLGIRAGDIIAYETKTEFTESGYIKSRFLDDKASVAILLALLKYFSAENKKPRFDTKFIFTVYEEVGHGASPFGEGLTEAIAVDMGCIGEDLTCDEQKVSICAADGSGPYDYELTGKLIELAEKNGLNFAVDIYPYYGSDVGAMLRAGHDLKGALIGPGVHASHGMERTHKDGMINTLKLLKAYLA